MDFHGMKRKQLQTLCKKHGVPANLANRAMADRLASMFKENEEPVSVEKLSTIPEEIVSENGAEVAKRRAKKVRFSPENQTFLYEVSVYRRPPRRSRKQLLPKNPARTMENAPNSEDIGKVEERQVGIARSRVQNAVEDGVNTVFSPPVGRKRGRRGMKNRDGKVNDIDKSEVVEMGSREDVKNASDEVTGRITRWQLSRKNVTQEDSKKARKGKGCDEVHLLDESIEQSDVVRQDVKTRNGPKRPTSNDRKEGQSVKLSSEVEKVEVVSRVTRQSRAQSKVVASIVKSEVKTVGVQGGCEEVLQLELKKGRVGKNALRQDTVPQNVSADNSLFALEGAEAEKPLRRSKRNVKKDWTKSAAVQVQSETQVTKPQEQSGGDVALEEPPECARRYSSRRKSVVPLSGKGENEEEFAKRKNKKRTRTTDLDAIVEHSGKVERAAGAPTSQDLAPVRSRRRKTVILNTSGVTDAELANKEDIGKMQQLRASFLGKDVTEGLPRMSTRNSSRYNSSETSKEDQIVFAETDWGLKLQTKEPNVEEEKRSVVEEHPIKEKPQRRSKRITSRSASVAPLNPIATVVTKQQNKYRMTIIEEDATLTESLSAPGELPAEKDGIVVVEGAGNQNDLDLNISREAVKNSDRFLNKKREELRGNSEAKQCGFGKESPLFVDMEEDNDSVGKMNETLITTSMKLLAHSTDGEVLQSATNSMAFYERESNLLGDDRQTLVHCGNVESEVNCMSYQSVNIKCALDEASCSDKKFLEFEGNANHGGDSSEITFPTETQAVEAAIATTGIAVKIGGHGMFDQEMKEDSHSALESLVVYEGDRNNPVESEKDKLVQVDTAETDSEMNHHHLCWSVNGRLDVDGPNLVEPRQAEFESEASNMEIISLGATSSMLNPEKLETESTRGESANFASDRVNVNVSRTPFGEDQILVKLNDANVSASESVREATFEDHLNEFDKIICLKKAEEMIATNFSDTEGIPSIESSVEATANQENSAEFHFPILETVCQKIAEIQRSTYSDTAAPETPSGSAPENQIDENTCRFEAAIETTASGVFDQGMIEDLHPGNAHRVCDSISTKDFTRLVRDDKEIRIHDDNFEGEMKYQSCLSLKGKGAIDDSNLVEARIVDFESKVISPEISSPTGGFSSASQSDLASRFSSCIELVKQVETKEPLTHENINSINDSIDAEGSRTPFEDDEIKVQVEDANVTAAELIGDVLFSDLLNELGECIGLKRGSENPLKKTENQSACEPFDEEGIAYTERSIEAMDKQEDGAENYIVTELTGTPNITEIKRNLSSEIATCRNPFGLVPQSQDKQCSAGNTVSIATSEMCNQDEETSLVDDEEILDQDNTIETETKYQPRLSLNKTDALDEALAEPRMFELENNANKVVFFKSTSLADVCSSANQAKLSGETSNELKFDRDLESEKSPKGENVNYESNKIEVEDNKISAQKDLNLMQLEDTNMSDATTVPELVIWNSLNELCETCASKEFGISSKAEEARHDGSSGKEMEQTVSPVKINEMSEATAQIHNGTAGTSEKIITEMQWSWSGHDAFLISSPRPKVGSQDMQGSIFRVENAVRTAGYGMSSHQKNEENVKLVENESEQTINTERELFIGGKLILDEGSEGKFLADGACCPIPDRTDSQCAKGKQTDITEGSFNNVSFETEERHICEVFVGEETNPVSAEEKDNDPFSMKLHDHVLVDERRNCSGEMLVNLPFNDEFAATMDSKEICAIREKDVGQADDIMEEIALSSLKVELGDHGDCKMDAELHDSNMTVLETIETDVTGVSTQFPGDRENASVRTTVPVEKANCDDQSEEIAMQRDCSSSIRLDGFTSVVGIVDNNLKVGSTESTLNSKNPQSGRKVEDSDVSPYGMLDYIYAKTRDEANKSDAASMVEKTGQEDDGKTPDTYQRSFHGGRQEDVPSYVRTTCSKSEIGLASSTSLCSNIPVSCAEKELFPQVLDDTDDVGGTEISIECKGDSNSTSLPFHDNDIVARKERDECQKNTSGSDDVIDGSSVEKSRGDPEEIAAAESDDCEGSVNNDGLLVNQPLCLDESKSFDQENEEPHGLHLPDNGDSREVGSCGKLDIVSSVKPETVIGCSTVSSICATSFEHKHLENPDEPNILTNTEMNLFWPLWASENEFKKPDANAGDSNRGALDKTITECNSSDLKEGDYVPFSDVEDTKTTAKNDGPEAVQETIEARKDASALNAAMAGKSPLSKNSEGVAVVDHEEAFRSQLELLSSQKKNMTAKKEGSRSVFAKQLSPSTMRSKNKSNLIPRTPKRLIIHDAKENEPNTKTEQIGNRTTPKTSSKRRPLERVWKY